MSDIEIEIDGKKILAAANQMVIQVADEQGIYIPRFCYHKHLAIAANCRMCLVEVEKSPKALPACATPITPGMKVFTRSQKALAAQRAVMEFLLINHPLDCPICDQGGECELQDLSLGYGSAESYFCEGKRSVKDEDIGPLVATEMTRCIQCTRCVRFGDEVAGLRELGAINRGEDMEIRTYIPHALKSEISGNIIDLCPVGALTSKPFRFTARAWELDQYASVAPHDCLGSHIYVHTRFGKVMRVIPREHPAINETWISDRDRFSYEGLREDRLTSPLIREENEWREVDWPTALEWTVQKLKNVLSNAGGEQVASLASPNCTLEEFYLLQKLLRGIGSPHIDHRLRQSDFSDQDQFGFFPGLPFPIAELEDHDVIVLVGSNITKEQPLLATRLRKAIRKNAKVLAINMMDYRFNFPLAAKKIVSPGEFVDALLHLDDKLMQLIKNGKRVCMLLGLSALNHPEAASIRALAYDIAARNQGTLGFLTEGANSAGAWIAGAVPHRGAGLTTLAQQGLTARTMFSESRRAYILLNIDPELDCGNPVRTAHALEDAECVIAITPFKNSLLAQHAHVLLPMAPFTETSGTFVNVEGSWQTFQGATKPLGESRPAWKILRVLGNLLELKGFDFQSTDEIREELERVINSTEQKSFTPHSSKPKSSKENVLTRIGDIPLYSYDNLVRRAKALQATQAFIEGEVQALRIHPETAKSLHLKEGEMVFVKQGEQRIKLPVIFDERVALRAALIFGGTEVAAGLPELFGAIEIVK